MSINISRAGEASRASGFFSADPNADSLVDKVLKLFMAIILAPVSAIKYSVGFVTSSFKKENSKTTSEKLAFAANSAVSRIKEAVEPFKDLAVKNKSTIVKVVIAAAVVTGAVYAYRSYNGEIQTQPIDINRKTHLNFTIFLNLAAVLGIVGLIKNALEEAPIYPKNERDLYEEHPESKVFSFLGKGVLGIVISAIQRVAISVIQGKFREAQGIVHAAQHSLRIL